MSRIILKQLGRSAVPATFSASVTAAMGSGRYKVLAADGTVIIASSQGPAYSRGDLVRLRGTEITGRITAATNIKTYEV